MVDFLDLRHSLVMSRSWLLPCWWEECPNLLRLMGKGNPTLFQNLEGSLGTLPEFPVREKGPLGEVCGRHIQK